MAGEVALGARRQQGAGARGAGGGDALNGNGEIVERGGGIAGGVFDG